MNVFQRNEALDAMLQAHAAGLISNENLSQGTVMICALYDEQPHKAKVDPYGRTPRVVAAGAEKRTYLVWNRNRSECVGFTDKEDAEQAAGLQPMGNPCAAVAESWRELYADDDELIVFEMQEVSL